MARRVEGFNKEESERRRYNWAAWTDGRVWEIRRGEDYDVTTENMRSNLHARARREAMTMRTELVRDEDGGEGLRFQFRASDLESPRDRMLRVVGQQP